MSFTVCGVLGQVWYFMISIPDICLLSYSEVEMCLFVCLFVINVFDVVVFCFCFQLKLMNLETG